MPKPRPEPRGSRPGIDALWQAHDRLAAQKPIRFDPLAWRDFEHKLLWLDEAAGSGAGLQDVGPSDAQGVAELHSGGG